ncbi:MAG: thioredoxin-like domain-containing protein, partial [Pirellulales bacterium]
GKFPFASRQPAPSLAGGSEWINVDAPLDVPMLRGKFVLLDFWTYCCINCIHILPELKKLELAHPGNLVVIGVHSGKFVTERDADNIRAAVLRYQIAHPVVNDPDFVLWRRFGVDTWPTLRLIDPEGNLVAGTKGEVEFAALDRVIRNAVPYYRRKGVLDETPLEFNLEHHQAQDTPLRFPGKLLADEAGDRLFIADSNHNRIVISRLDGELLDIIGTGAVGRDNGRYDQATFNNPQGMALRGDTLYVADTQNHMLRKVDLRTKQVATIAGTGQQRREARPQSRRNVGVPIRTRLASPWALWIHGDELYIAMAGPHQIWRMALDERQIGVHAGSGVEDIVDGPLAPRGGSQTSACFAQPSGLASDGRWLYVADSEGSSIRAVPLGPTGLVKTVIGTAHLAADRLFVFGDVDGPLPLARLQHPLGVVWYRERLYVADTYNSKIKVVDPGEQRVQTIAQHAASAADGPLFDEPAGLSAAGGKLYVADTNQHRIRVIDLADESVTTLNIDALDPPQPVDSGEVALAGAEHVRLRDVLVQGEQGELLLTVRLNLPPGYKMNDLAPTRYRVDALDSGGPVDPSALGMATRLATPQTEFDIRLPLTSSQGQTTLKVSLTYYYCQESGGLCKVGSVVWNVPVRIREGAETNAIDLPHRVK